MNACHPMYQIDTKENRAFLERNARELLAFGRRFPSPHGSAWYLGDDGTPWTNRNRETWITCRMAHVYSLGALMGQPGCARLAAEALRGLNGELRDRRNGGWFPGVTPDGQPLPEKQCYTHAFVILAATSAVTAGIADADALLQEALEVFDRYFWDDRAGLTVDHWNTAFSIRDPYRGINANMHAAEAFLAVADCTGREFYRERAGRIVRSVIGWASANQWRIPEHFSEDWNPLPDYNKEHPDDPFKPYGATPGHGLEWARLITQWSLSSSEPSGVEVAERLFHRAVADAWETDGAPGLVYTTDWQGKPIVHDRMHWTLAEGINTAAVLYHVTGRNIYADYYARFMQYLDQKVHDPVNGSWFHQLDRHNRVIGTVWPGKSDLYHALQSMLIPRCPPSLSVAAALKAKQLCGAPCDI